MSTTAHPNQTRYLRAPADLGQEASIDISAGLGALLADVLALYFKTKTFHWHISGPHFQDHHLLLDGQANQLPASCWR